MSRILPGLLAIVLLLPLLLLYTGGYSFVNVFPYGAYVHKSVAVASSLSLPLLGIGFFGFLLGMIWPRLTLWFGSAGRFRVAVLYLPVFLCGVALQFEIPVLNKWVVAHEREVLGKLHSELLRGQSTQEILETMKRVDENLIYSFGDDSSYDRTAGFPRGSSSAPVIDISPPGYRMDDGIVLRMSANPREPNARSEQVVLLMDEKVTAITPALKESDPRVYWGTLAVGRNNLTFTPCGDAEVPADSSEFEATHVDATTIFADNSSETTNYRRYTAITGGIMDTLPDGSRRFRIISMPYTHSADSFSSYSCDFWRAPGTMPSSGD